MELVCQEIDSDEEQDANGDFTTFIFDETGARVHERDNITAEVEGYVSQIKEVINYVVP